MNFNKKIVEKYLENLYFKKNLSNTTIEAYEKDISDFLIYINKNDYSIFNLDKNNFDEYFNFLKMSKKISTVKRKYSAIKNFYKYLFKNKYVENYFTYNLKKLLSKNNELKDKIELNTNNKNTDTKIKQSLSLKEYNDFLNSLDNNLILKLLVRLVIEVRIKLTIVFEIKSENLLKYNFKEIIIIKNNKVYNYKVNESIEKLLKNYYEIFAKEKRYFFGTYNRTKFYTDLKKNNLSLEILKKSQEIDIKNLEDKIREKYFEIGIGDR